MRLFHFTTHQHYLRICHSGLSRGRMPWRMVRGEWKYLRLHLGTEVITNFHWLTADPEWGQPWASPHVTKLPMRKDEIRITVEIPNAVLAKLFRWRNFHERMPSATVEFINRFSGSHHWFLFAGPIPKEWFVEVAQNPVPVDLREMLNHE